MAVPDDIGFLMHFLTEIKSYRLAMNVRYDSHTMRLGVYKDDVSED